MLRFNAFKESRPQGWSKVVMLKDEETFSIAVEGMLIQFERLIVGLGKGAEHGSSEIYAALWGMLGQSFVAGKVDCFFDPGTRKTFEYLKARLARAANVTASKTRNQKLDKAIVAEVKVTERKMAKSIGYAKLIGPGVRTRLRSSLESKYSTDGKIKNRLSKIDWTVLQELTCKLDSSSRADLLVS
jgi:hypothetical protein